LAGLQKHVNHFTVLVDRTPEIVLFAVDLHEHFLDRGGVPIPPMFSLQSPGEVASPTERIQSHSGDLA
jgi:hypothetical protein